jgi:tRNA-specific 2-thiouridylase
MNLAVLLSGGVDSSVALHLARQARGGTAGLRAFYLKIWLEDELAHLGTCPWEDDLAYARAVCDQAGVPLEVVSLQAEYHERVVTAAVAELRAGRTPSPDLWCNERIKFGLFLERSGRGFDRVVSGHYAQIERGAAECVLKCSPDPVKDQTYFLARLSQEQLQRLEFPIGQLRKQNVRAAAAALNLATRDRPDSQGICFLGKLKYTEFVRHYLGEQPGDVVEMESGRRLSRHHGCWFYTIGQRKGIGLSGGPWYVVGKDLRTNVVFVSHSAHHLGHARRAFDVESLHWISGRPPELDRERVTPGTPRLSSEAATRVSGADTDSRSCDPGPSGACEVAVKVRHSPHRVRGRIAPRRGGVWEVILEEADPGIAPGQAAVFYQGDICLGSGFIL